MRDTLDFLIVFDRIVMCTLNLSRKGEIVMSTTMHCIETKSEIRLREAGSLLLLTLPIQS